MINGKRASMISVAVVATMATSSHAAPLTKSQETRLLQAVDANRSTLESLASDIWNYAEIGFSEEKSSARLQKELQTAGFQIDPELDGMPTAFSATAGSGGPVIAILAEFDALPGLAQNALPQLSPIAKQAAGHGCGHNLLGAASVVAAIAIRNWLSANHILGTVRLYGTPAEEGGFAKVYLTRDGYLKDVDAVLTWHPGDRKSATPNRSLAMMSGKFLFSGVAAHAAAAPQIGRSALDGVEIMDVAANFLREHVPSDTRIHYVVTKGGGQPNIVPAVAENFYFVRNHDANIVRDVWKRLEKTADGAALASGTTVSVDVTSGAFDTLPNVTLSQIVHGKLARVGGVTYSPADAVFAAEIRKSYADRAVDEVRATEVEPFTAERKSFASSDVGDISWTIPTASFTTATWVSGTGAHSWQAAATSGMAIGWKGALVAAKTLALSAAELFLNPKKITAAKAELDARRGPGFQYRALIGDRKPALDYNKN